MLISRSERHVNWRCLYRRIDCPGFRDRVIDIEPRLSDTGWVVVRHMDMKVHTAVVDHIIIVRDMELGKDFLYGGAGAEKRIPI